MHKCRWKTQRFLELALSSNALKEKRITLKENNRIIKENNTIIKDQNLVAETLDNYFTNVVDSLDIEPYSAFENQQHVSNITKYWDHNQFDFSLTNHELVKSALEKIKANKARVHDHIPSRALKASIPSII